MRTPRGPSRTLWSLHRTVPTSDVPLSPAGTPESKSFSPDVLSYHWLANLTAYRGRRGVDLLVRGPDFAAAVSHYDGSHPRNAFRRVRDLRAFTHKRQIAKSFGLLNTPVPFRLLSIRARTSGGATDFFLASALFDHHPTLRSTGEEGARCAEPTSATQTKTCTRTSRVPDSLHGFHRVDVPRRLRLRTTRSGIRRFHDLRYRFGGPTYTRCFLEL